jgi:3'(2'), 5'-bisphosphate nucleotidase
MPHAFADERRFAIEAVTLASRLTTAVQCEIEPEALAKRDKSPVTVADFGSQAVVCRLLGEQFPNDLIVAEEDAADLRLAENEHLLERVVRHVRGLGLDADARSVCDWIDRGAAEPATRFWTLDPVDGTKGFLRKEQYAIALALIVGGRVEVGALACPNLAFDDDVTSLGIVFVAVRGEGAFARPLAGGPERAIRVSNIEDPAEARFCESVESGHSAHDDAERLAILMQIKAPPVRMDSQAKYGVLARGRAELYLRLPTRADYRERIWDHAAGSLIVEEAGGLVRDIGGNSLDFSQGRALEANRGIIAGAPRFVHAAVEGIARLDIA